MSQLRNVSNLESGRSEASAEDNRSDMVVLTVSDIASGYCVRTIGFCLWVMVTSSEDFRAFSYIGLGRCQSRVRDIVMLQYALIRSAKATSADFE
jgi:hypothetical protein